MAKTYEGAELAQNRDQFGLSTAKNHYNVLFAHIDGFQFLLIFWVPNLSYLPVFQEGTTFEFAALGSSHKCPGSFRIKILATGIWLV